MKLILFYHEDTAQLGETFKNSMTRHWAGTETEVFQSVSRLKHRMRQNSDFFEEEVYIIFVDSKNRLIELLLISHWMEDKHLILILPDSSEETIRLAMHLYPRFTTNISDDYEDLHLVLQQMSSGRKRDEKKKA